MCLMTPVWLRPMWHCGVLQLLPLFVLCMTLQRWEESQIPKRTELPWCQRAPHLNHSTLYTKCLVQTHWGWWSTLPTATAATDSTWQREESDGTCGEGSRCWQIASSQTTERKQAQGKLSTQHPHQDPPDWKTYGLGRKCFTKPLKGGLSDIYSAQRQTAPDCRTGTSFCKKCMHRR